MRRANGEQPSVTGLRLSGGGQRRPFCIPRRLMNAVQSAAGRYGEALSTSAKRLADASDAIEQSIKLELLTTELCETALRVLTAGKAAIATSRLALLRKP